MPKSALKAPIVTSVQADVGSCDQFRSAQNLKQITPKQLKKRNSFSFLQVNWREGEGVSLGDARAFGKGRGGSVRWRRARTKGNFAVVGREPSESRKAFASDGSQQHEAGWRGSLSACISGGRAKLFPSQGEKGGSDPPQGEVGNDVCGLSPSGPISGLFLSKHDRIWAS